MAKGTHRVAGLRGAVVRAGIELDSEVVGELDHGAVLSAVSHCTSRLGVERVRISAPLSGWCTLRVLEQLPASDAPTATLRAKPGSFQSFVMARRRDELRPEPAPPPPPPLPISSPAALVLADTAAAAAKFITSFSSETVSPSAGARAIDVAPPGDWAPQNDCAPAASGFELGAPGAARPLHVLIVTTANLFMWDRPDGSTNKGDSVDMRSRPTGGLTLT